MWIANWTTSFTHKKRDSRCCVCPLNALQTIFTYHVVHERHGPVYHTYTALHSVQLVFDLLQKLEQRPLRSPYSGRYVSICWPLTVPNTDRMRSFVLEICVLQKSRKCNRPSLYSLIKLFVGTSLRGWHLAQCAVHTEPRRVYILAVGVV